MLAAEVSRAGPGPRRVTAMDRGRGRDLWRDPLRLLQLEGNGRLPRELRRTDPTTSAASMASSGCFFRPLAKGGGPGRAALHGWLEDGWMEDSGDQKHAGSPVPKELTFLFLWPPKSSPVRTRVDHGLVVLCSR